MEIKTIDFGNIQGQWEIKEMKDGTYLMRDNFFNRLRLPAMESLTQIDELKKKNIKNISFTNKAILCNNPKTFNPYVKFVGDKETGSNIVIVMISKPYQLISVDDTNGFIHSCITFGNDVTGCFISLPEGMSGKCFNALLLHGKNLVRVKLTYTSTGRLSYNEDVTNEDVSNFKYSDDTFKLGHFKTSHKTPCTLAYMIKEDDESLESVLAMLNESDVIKHRDGIRMVYLPKKYTEKDIMKNIIDLKVNGYHAVTFVNINITPAIYKQRYIHYLFTMDKNGEIYSIKTH